ncbi:MAG: phospholipase, partial [Alphaproteobacteria bacterium]|nr:phospholipase [Alphaproteobacteria bacterium]
YSGIDGSIFDNPCVSYHGAIRQHLDAGTRVIMILLGTGYTHRSFKKEDWNSYGGLGVVDPVNDLPLINILFHAPESALIESFRQELGDDLFVFNKSLVADIGKPDAVNMAIDDAGSENLKRMSHFSEAILEEQSQEFDRLCHILVRNRDSKPQKRSFWSRLLD